GFSANAFIRPRDQTGRRCSDDRATEDTLQVTGQVDPSVGFSINGECKSAGSCGCVYSEPRLIPSKNGLLADTNIVRPLVPVPRVGRSISVTKPKSNRNPRRD